MSSFGSALYLWEDCDCGCKGKKGGCGKDDLDEGKKGFIRRAAALERRRALRIRGLQRTAGEPKDRESDRRSKIMAMGLRGQKKLPWGGGGAQIQNRPGGFRSYDRSASGAIKDLRDKRGGSKKESMFGEALYVWENFERNKRVFGHEAATRIEFEKGQIKKGIPDPKAAAIDRRREKRFGKNPG